MFLKKILLPCVAGLFALLAVSAVSTNLSHAAKPGGGGGGGGGALPTGTIYFGARYASSDYGMNSMNSDGSGKTALPISDFGVPSRLLHGGHRWFLTTRPIAGETYPDQNQRHEQFAIRDDGNEVVTVQMTDDPTFQRIGRWGWAPGETAGAGLVSGFGRRYEFDGVDWVVDPASVGIYTAIVLFDGQGNVLGLDDPPAFLASVGVVDGAWPDAYDGFDWSPDLTEIVYSNDEWTALRILNLVSGETRTLTTGGGGYHPKWSPAGNLIVFGNSAGSIETIAPDGTGRREVIRWGVSYAYRYPAFSPTGSHILYSRIPHGSLETDLYRATPSGSNKVNLTSGIAGHETNYGWR